MTRRTFVQSLSAILALAAVPAAAKAERPLRLSDIERILAHGLYPYRMKEAAVIPFVAGSIKIKGRIFNRHSTDTAYFEHVSESPDLSTRTAREWLAQLASDMRVAMYKHEKEMAS